MSIKLKVPSKAEQEAREARKAPEKKKPPPRAPRKPTASKASKTAGVNNNKSPAIVTDVPPAMDGNSSPTDTINDMAPREEGFLADKPLKVDFDPPGSKDSQTGHPSEHQETLSSPPTITDPSLTRAAEDPSTTNTAITDSTTSDIKPTRPAPSQSSVIVQDPQPTIHKSPQVKRTKEDLPTFTASSPIPFGNPIKPGYNSTLLSLPTLVSADRPVAVYPNFSKDAEATSSLTSVVAEFQQGGKETETEESKPKPAAMLDIWAVPDTPVKHA